MSIFLFSQYLKSVRRWILFPLLALDIFLISQHAILYILQDIGHISSVPKWFNIFEEGSISEYLNWGKWLAISLLLLILWTRNWMTTALGFAVAFAVIAADDILMLHEKQGSTLAEHLSLGGMVGLKAQDMGEMIVYALLGSIVAGAVLIGFLFAKADGLQIGRALMTFLGLLVFFAVGLDMLHSLLSNVRGLNFLLGLMEDGGEMIIGSLCLAFCADLLASVSRGSLSVRNGAPLSALPPSSPRSK